MTSTILLAVGSLVPIVWGISHIAPVRSVVAGFGPLTPDNRRILTMEWVAEGLALIFLGCLTGLVLVTRGPAGAGAVLVYRAVAAMLIVMAVWTAVTGARTAIVPMKICPIVKSASALCLIFGSAGV